MGWFYGFKPDDVGALTMYQLQGYIKQIPEIHNMVNGTGEDDNVDDVDDMTDDELRDEGARYNALLREAMR